MRASSLAVVLCLGVGCASGGRAALAGSSGKLEEVELVNNLFCGDSSRWSTVFTGDLDATTTPQSAARSELLLVWTPPSRGDWDLVVIGPDSAERPPGIGLAQPRCDAMGDLVAGAFARQLSRQTPDARTTINTFEITEQTPYRLWIDVFEPPGLAVRVFARETPSSTVCSCDASCGACWCGTASENACPTSWNGVGDGCDCGCQFTDADCAAPAPVACGGPCPAGSSCVDGVCVSVSVASDCAGASTCAECTMLIDCGWCDGACTPGSVAGPIGDDSCAEWAWATEQCPPG